MAFLNYARQAAQEIRESEDFKNLMKKRKRELTRKFESKMIKQTPHWRTPYQLKMIVRPFVLFVLMLGLMFLMYWFAA